MNFFQSEFSFLVSRVLWQDQIEVENLKDPSQSIPRGTICKISFLQTFSS